MRTPKYTTGVVCLLTAVIIAVSVTKRSGSTPQGNEQAAPAQKSTSRHTLNRPYKTALGIRRGVEFQGDKHRANSGKNVPPTSGTDPVEAPVPEIFDAFERWTQEYISRKGKANVPALLRTGESLAIQRRAALAELIESDPEQALEMTLPAATRHELPASIARHLEERVAGRGSLDVIATVFEPGAQESPDSSIIRVVTYGDRRFKAFVYGRRLHQTSMDGISLHGIAVGGSMAVHESPVRVLEALEVATLPAPSDGGHCPVSNEAGSSSVAVQAGDEIFYLCDTGHIAPLTAAYVAEEESAGTTGMAALAASGVNALTQGEKSVRVLRVNFPDDLDAPISEALAENVMQQVSDFFTANSYGTLGLNITISPLLTLPNPKSWYATNDENSTRPAMLREAQAAAAAAGLPEADLDLVFVKPGVLSNSRANVGSKGAWLQSNNPTIVAHEIGHNLGLWHANAWRTTDGSIIGPGLAIEYGNRFDTMGSGWGQFNAFNKNKLNWLPSTAVQTITAGGIYRLYPADVPALDEGKVYALKLRKDDLREYWIETGQTLKGGLLVNWSESFVDPFGTQLLDMTPETRDVSDASLKPGEGFYDSALGLKIICLGPSASDPGAVEVMVTSVHYAPIEAENALIGQGIAREQDPLASQGAYISLPESSRAAAALAINVPESGEYVIWARVRRSSGGLAQVSVAIDNGAPVQVTLETSPNGEWQWSRISVPMAGSVLGVQPFALSAGLHTLRLAGNDAHSMIDCLLLTNDPTTDLPPAISTVANQVSVASAPLRVSFSIAEIGASDADARITVQSLDLQLVPNSGITLKGSGMTRTLDITPSRNQLGTGTIMITAIDSDGTSISRYFTITVIGPIQALVEAAAPGDTIILPEGTYVDQVIIDRNLTLVGTGTRETIINGNKSFVPLTVTSNAVVVVRNLTLRNGRAIRNYGNLTLIECSIDENFGSDKGGGIWNGSSGTLLLQGSTISNNRVFALGGGIYNDGELIVMNSTISGNRATAKNRLNGGGIYNAGSLYSQNSTITANHAPSGGGLVNAGVAQLRSTILAGNTVDSGVAPDGHGELISGGHNLVQNIQDFGMTGDLIGNIVGQDPLLGPLADNGGATLTHALMAESPAIDAGSAEGLTMDQRGFARHLDLLPLINYGDASDIGAFEYGAEAEHDGVQLSFRVEPNGDVTVLLSGKAGSFWNVQATSDFLNWETLGIVAMENGSGEITDHASSAHGDRFYSATAY